MKREENEELVEYFRKLDKNEEMEETKKRWKLILETAIKSRN